jgi:hypothetical protein
METQVFEGTLAEIQHKLRELPYAPDKRLRVVVTEPASEDTRPVVQGPFRPTEFRNGVPLLPLRETAEPVTTDMVKRLQDPSRQ